MEPEKRMSELEKRGNFLLDRLTRLLECTLFAARVSMETPTICPLVSRARERLTNGNSNHKNHRGIVAQSSDRNIYIEQNTKPHLQDCCPLALLFEGF